MSQTYQKERDQLLSEVKPLLTEEGYADLTFWPFDTVKEIEALKLECEAIKRFVPDGTIGY